MSEVSVTLQAGITSTDSATGKTTQHTEAVLRELTAGELLDAKAASEQLMQTRDGPVLVGSPALMGLHMLCAQIVRIGDIEGPLRPAELRKLSGFDLATLEAKAEELDRLIGMDVLRGLDQRGRSAGDGDADGKSGD